MGYAMLLQFTVGNYRSFRDRVTFSLMAEPQERSHSNSFVQVPFGTIYTKALSLAVLYGANASGKSNFLQAISVVQNLIAWGVRPNEPIYVEPFTLDSNTKNNPSFFEIYFSIGNTLYSYGFECDIFTIHKEWLRTGAEDRVLFTRISEGNIAKVEVNPELIHLSQTSSARWDFIAEGTKPNQLFLAQAVEQNVFYLSKITSWFRNNVYVHWPNSRHAASLIGLQDQSTLNRLGEFLKSADTGIERLELLEEDFNLSQLPDHERRNAEFEMRNLGGAYFTVVLNGDPITLKLDIETNKVSRLRLQAVHTGTDKKGIPLDWSTESDGTRRIAELWQMIFMYNGGLLGDAAIFIDEIERSLHPELVRFIIEEWRNQFTSQKSLSRPGELTNLFEKKIEKQLIFTTHNDNFLEDDLLRRDEVWFVEKDKTGATHMTSEIEYKPAEGVTRQRAYLDGMYGGTPRIPGRRFHWVSRENS